MGSNDWFNHFDADYCYTGQNTHQVLDTGLDYKYEALKHETAQQLFHHGRLITGLNEYINIIWDQVKACLP